MCSVHNEHANVANREKISLACMGIKENSMVDQCSVRANRIEGEAATMLRNTTVAQ